MPYFIYQINQTPGVIVKNLELIDSMHVFKQAKQKVRELRGENDSADIEFKVIFADNELEAEEKLQEKREAPVVMEWEK